MFRARTMHPRIAAHNRLKYPDMSNYGILRQIPEKSRPGWVRYRGHRTIEGMITVPLEYLDGSNRMKRNNTTCY